MGTIPSPHLPFRGAKARWQMPAKVKAQRRGHGWPQLSSPCCTNTPLSWVDQPLVPPFTLATTEGARVSSCMSLATTGRFTWLSPAQALNSKKRATALSWLQGTCLPSTVTVEHPETGGGHHFAAAIPPCIGIAVLCLPCRCGALLLSLR